MYAEFVEAREDSKILDYATLPHAAYAVPTPDPFLPLVYMLGATKGETPLVFNNHCELGTIAMTDYAFGMNKLLLQTGRTPGYISALPASQAPPTSSPTTR